MRSNRVELLLWLWSDKGCLVLVFRGCLFVLVRFDVAAEKDTTTVVGGGGLGLFLGFDCGLDLIVVRLVVLVLVCLCLVRFRFG